MAFRVGIVGTGENARDHARACQRVRGVHLAAICDVSAAALKRFGDEFHVSRRYNSLDAMLASEQLDVLIVSVWGIDHAQLSIAAASSGKTRALLVEKPISMNAADCDAMIVSARANHVLLMEGFKWRHDPQHIRAKEVVESGRVGSIKSVHGTLSSPLVRFAGADNWRFDPRRGGGSVYDTASYLIHFSRFILAAEPVRVFATGSYGEPAAAEMSAAILLEFPGNETAQLTSSYQSGYCQTIEILGTRGWLRMDLPFDSRSVREREFVEEEDLPATFRVSYDNFASEEYRFAPVNQFELQLSHLCECLEGKATPRIAPEFSLGNMRVLDAVRESLRSRLPVALLPATS
jgi:xylose dehydrogenase (NAD/NADP)